MTSSNWRLTYDPAGANTVLVDFGTMLESDELEPQLDKKVETVDLIDSPAPFLRIGQNAVTSFSFRVISEESTDSAARAAMLDGLIAAELATKKPLRIEVSGVSNAYWQFSNATVKSHKPKRLLGYDTPANVTQYDFSATGLTKGIKIAKVAVVGDSIIAATSDAPGSPYFITQFLGNGWPAQMKARCQRKIEIARNSLTGKFDHGIGGIKAEGFMVGGTYRTTFLDAINSDADTILICVGANDMNVTANSTAAANIISLWDEVIAAGKTLIAVAIPPTRTSRPSGDEAAWKAAQVATNAILSAAKNSRWMLWFDYQSSIDDNSDGYMDSVFAGDHIHPNICGAATIGEYMAAQLLPYTDNVVQYPIPDFGSVSWLTPNPFVDGTIASNAVPTGWVANVSAFQAAVPGSTMVRNIIARADGINGNLLEVTTSGITVTDLLLTAPLVIPQVYVDAADAALTTADTLQAFCELEIVSGDFYNIELALNADATRCIDLAHNGAMLVSASGSILPVGSIQLITPEWSPTSNAAYDLRCHLRAYGNGVLKVGRTGIFKV
jgi:lysophospholipase L1-like esterase